MPKRASSVMGNEEPHFMSDSGSALNLSSEKELVTSKYKSRRGKGNHLAIKVDKKPDANLIVEAGEDEEAMTPYLPLK